MVEQVKQGKLMVFEKPDRVGESTHLFEAITCVG